MPGPGYRILRIGLKIAYGKTLPVVCSMFIGRSVVRQFLNINFSCLSTANNIALRLHIPMCVPPLYRTLLWTWTRFLFWYFCVLCSYGCHQANDAIVPGGTRLKISVTHVDGMMWNGFCCEFATRSARTICCGCVDRKRSTRDAYGTPLTRTLTQMRFYHH